MTPLLLIYVDPPVTRIGRGRDDRVQVSSISVFRSLQRVHVSQNSTGRRSPTLAQCKERSPSTN